MIPIERSNVVPVSLVVDVTTAEQSLVFPQPINSMSLLAGATSRVRVNKPLIISSAPDVYKYTAATGVFSQLTLPYTLNSLTANDRLFFGVDNDVIAALNITVGNANGNASVLSAYYASADRRPLSPYTAGNWTALKVISDGTSSGGKTLAQSGIVTFGPPLRNYVATHDSKGRVWLMLAVSADLDASVSVTACAAYGQHISVGTTALPQVVEASRLYYLCDTGSTTLTVTGAS